MIGFVPVDKPGGMTSHDVVAAGRRLLGTRKIGHAGTLDPMATGLLVLGVGRATRLIRYVQGAPKTYLATMVMGVATESLDADGAVLSREPINVTEAEVRDAASRFIGTIMQVPPMVSARKIGGRRLYELAREGTTVEREARPVEIHGIDILDFSPCDYPEVTFRVRCSTGTYVRTLGDDIAQALGGRAHLTALRRERIGSLDVADAFTLERLEDMTERGSIDTAILQPAEALADLPSVAVDPETARRVGHGTVLPAEAFGGRGGEVAVVDGDGTLLAVYRVDDLRARPEVVLS